MRGMSVFPVILLLSAVISLTYRYHDKYESGSNVNRQQLDSTPGAVTSFPELSGPTTDSRRDQHLARATLQSSENTSFHATSRLFFPSQQSYDDRREPVTDSGLESSAESYPKTTPYLDSIPKPHDARTRYATNADDELVTLDRISSLSVQDHGLEECPDEIVTQYRGLTPIGSLSVTMERRLDDGKFIAVPSGRYKFYMFSAFWDDRNQLSSPVVRVITLLETNRFLRAKEILNEIVCHMFYTRANTSHVVISRPAMLSFNTPGRQNISGQVMHSATVTCAPCSCKEYHVRVSVGDSRLPSEARRNWEAGSTLMVEVLRERNEPVVELGTCVPIVYGHLNPFFLVEWIELQKILGVGQMFVTSEGLDQEATNVIDHYVRQGFMKVQNSHFIHLEDSWLDLRSRSSLSVTHCMYRNMYNFNRIMILDADEVIVPRMHHTLLELLKHLSELDGHANRAYVLNYRFLHSEFIRGISDPEAPEHSIFLRHRKKMPYAEDEYHVKSIVDPKFCITARNHKCMTPLRGKIPIQFHTVPRDLAGDLHYRTKPKNNRWLSKQYVNDDVMLKYRDQLLERVQRELDILDMGKF